MPQPCIDWFVLACVTFWGRMRIESSIRADFVIRHDSYIATNSVVCRAGSCGWLCALRVPQVSQSWRAYKCLCQTGPWWQISRMSIFSTHPTWWVVRCAKDVLYRIGYTGIWALIWLPCGMQCMWDASHRINILYVSAWMPENALFWMFIVRFFKILLFA